MPARRRHFAGWPGRARCLDGPRDPYRDVGRHWPGACDPRSAAHEHRFADASRQVGGRPPDQLPDASAVPRRRVPALADRFGATAEGFSSITASACRPVVFLLAHRVTILHTFAMLDIVLPFRIGDVCSVEAIEAIDVHIDIFTAPIAVAP